MTNKLPRIKTKTKKRRGRGYGSGKGGHTSGRGMKGQKSRSKINIMFEGIKVKKSLLRRLPLQRGKGKNTGQPKPLVLNLDDLNKLRDGAKVNPKTLAKAGVIGKDEINRKIKILSNGKLTKKLVVELPTSRSAALKIEKLGGKVEV